MRIVIDARIINSTTGRYAERLIHHLEEIDTENEYIILVPARDLAYYEPQNPRFSIQPADFANYSLAEQTSFKSFLDDLQADLVHFCMPQQPVRYKGKHITTFHDLTLLKTYNSDKNFFIFKFKQFVGRFVFKAVARSSSHIICPTHYVKDELIRFTGISSQKVTVTHEGAATTKVRSQAYEPMVGKSYIMYVGNQSDYKNIRRLVAAHRQVRKQYPDLLLVFVGKIGGKNGQSLAINKAWVESQGFEGVVYTGFVPDEQLRWLYEHCRAYVFPSLMEGFGLPGLEAMAAGAPVVSSNATCLPEVLGDAAQYFNPTDIEDMANAIKQVIGNEEYRQELIKKGEEQAAKYSWRRMAEQTLAIYNQVLKQK